MNEIPIILAKDKVEKLINWLNITMRHNYTPELREFVEFLKDIWEAYN